MMLRSEVIWQRDGDEPGFLLDQRTGGIFGLNRTAADVLDGLARGENVEVLSQLLASRYAVFHLTARGDVMALLGRLEKLDLVQH